MTLYDDSFKMVSCSNPSIVENYRIRNLCSWLNPNIATNDTMLDMGIHYASTFTDDRVIDMTID